MAWAFFTSSEKKKRPIRRLADATVCIGSWITLALAALPTSTEPSSRKETTLAETFSP